MQSTRRESTGRRRIRWLIQNLEYAIRPILHCNEILVPVFKGLPELELPGSEEDQASVLSTNSGEDSVSDVGFPPSSLPQLFSQGELNDLT